MEGYAAAPPIGLHRNQEYHQIKLPIVSMVVPNHLHPASSCSPPSPSPSHHVLRLQEGAELAAEVAECNKGTERA